MQRVRVPKTFEHRIVPRWFEKIDRSAKDRIEQSARMQNIEVEGEKITAEMKLGTVVQWTAAVMS
jgi:hypothetical protein